MRTIVYGLSGALVVLGLALGTPDAFAQSRGHGGGGGGARTNSGGGGGGTAVSRGSGGGGGGGHVSGSGGARTAGPSSTASSGSGGQAVGGSRSNNDGRPLIGQAVPRQGAYYDRNNHYRYYGYNPYYLYGYGAFGLGAFYYDPFWWGGYPYGWGGYPYGPYGYYGGYPYYGGGGYAYDPQDAYGVKGGVKLKVEPKDAEVYVDGYYVGIVDDYNGAFQRLNLTAGTHRLEFKAKGYQPLTVDVKVEPRETITYRGDLQLEAAPK